MDTHAWEEKDGWLHKLFTFDTFTEALSFVNRVGDIAEKMQHHPDIRLQNYNEVVIKSTTHDSGNMVTDKDRTLTQAIDTLFE